MFTIEQIKAAHANVKSGADFPNYIKDLVALGVTGYETFVTDGHTEYAGNADHSLRSAAGYETLAVAQKSDAVRFQSDLKAHQKGKTDYKTFCADCANSGVEKWVVDTTGMTCTYYDLSGNELLRENIPQ